MAQFFSRVIENISESRIVLKEEQIGRSFSFGSDWNSIGVGLRVSVNMFGTQSNGAVIWAPQSYFGFCSGTDYMIKDNNTTNWVGVRHRSGIRYDTSTNNGYWSVAPPYGDPVQGITKIGSTIIPGSGLDNYSLFHMAAMPISHSSWLYFQLTKLNPKWAFGLVSQTSYTTQSYSRELFLRDMEDPQHRRFTADPYWSIYGGLNVNQIGGGGFGGGTMYQTVNETSGSIDTFNIWWNEGFRTLEISDIVIARYF